MPAKKPFKYRFLYWSRLTHIYTSTALFSLMIFFCLTGYFLNHTSLFGGGFEQGEVEVPSDNIFTEALNINEPWLQGELEEIIQTHGYEVLETYLSDHHGLSKPKGIEWDQDYQELILQYDFPAGYASAIYTSDAGLNLQFRRGDALAIANDLHKGRHSGDFWSWLIDLTAWLLIVFSITGLIILYQNKKQRGAALYVLVAGLLSPLLFYFMFVPRLLGV